MEIFGDLFKYIWVGIVAIIGYIMRKINKNTDDINDLKNEVTKAQVYGEIFHEDIQELKKDIHEIRDTVQEALRYYTKDK